MEKLVFGQSSAQNFLTPEVLVPRLGETLIEKGVLSAAQLTEALKEQKKIRQQDKDSAPLLGQILVDMGFVSRQILDEVITEQIIKLRSALQDANAQLERRVMERTAELEEALRQLSQLSAAKSNFVANISHELRTPLTHLKGYLELLVQKDLGPLLPEQEHSLQIMQRASNRLEQLIEDLIRFSMSERGEITIRAHVFNLDETCVKILANLYEKAAAKQVFTHFYPCNTTTYVNADQEKISWVLDQLLDNAIKFTPQNGQVSLRIEIDGNYARIAVIDTGIGIPQEKIGTIFEPFHQLDGSSTRKFGGVGLGLALVAKIIEAHGSVVRVVSAPEKGSQFIFLLPLANQ